ncbi:high-affinity glucose transporter Hxt2p [Trichomonascus vanleenenianus]|uniref:high-affinity glucose transporter Hxt2p n=1 Tax=Trichomonascus vanleenenianus TaxID=2268995 RepID=UPI003EC962A6
MAYFGFKGSALNRACVLLITFPAFCCYGYNQSVAGGLLINPLFVKQFPQIDTVNTTGAQAAHNSTIQGVAISLYTVGGIFGALSTCVWGDILGRRHFIFFSSLVVLVGAVLMASATTFAQFMVARVILGLGTGATSATVPVWTSELSKIENRGSHSSSVGFFLSIGIALGFWIDFALSFVKTSSVSWRFPLAFQIIFCVIVMAFIYRLPESPRWLILKDRFDEAKYIIGLINEVEPTSELVESEITSVKHSLAIAASGTFTDVFKMGESRVVHRSLLAVLAMFFSQICAINVITFYANTIFQQYLKMNYITSSVLSGSMEIVQICGAWAAMYTIDRFGRRPLLVFSGIGMTICLALLSGLSSNTNNKAALDVAVVALFAINFIYSVGFAGCCFCYAAEIAPLHVRSIVNGFAVGTTWTTNFLIAMVTPVGISSIGYKYYIVWAVVNGVLITPIAYFCFPETKKRTGEEIDEIFNQATGFFDVVKVAANLPYQADTNPITGVDEELGGVVTPVEQVSVSGGIESEKK